MPTTLTNLISSVRTRLGDHVQEGAGTATGDGAQTRFRLPDDNIVVNSLTMTVSSVAYTAFTVDAESGWVTCTGTVPALSAPITFSYQYTGWSAARVQDAINAAIDQLFHNFYVEGVNATTMSTDGEGELLAEKSDGTDLGPEDRITRVEFDNGDRWVKLENWSIRRTATKKYIVWQNAPVTGYTLRITFVTRPTNLTSGSDTLETTAGLPARAEEPLVDYACAELLGDPLARRILADRAHNTQNENAVKSYEIENAARVFRARAELKAQKLRMEPLKARLQT